MDNSGSADGIVSSILRLSRAVEGSVRSETLDFGLTPVQTEALRFAGSYRPDVATVGNLARLLGVKHSTAIGVIRPLVARELIARTPHQYDGREKTLCLTERGRDALREVDRVRETLQRVMAVLSSTQVELVEEAIATLSEGMRKTGLLSVGAPCHGCVHFRPGEGTTAEHYCAFFRRDYTTIETHMLCPEHTAGETAVAS